MQVGASPATTRGDPDPIDVAVGARLRLQRRRMKLNQTQLAVALGVTFQQVQKYEHGGNRISAPTLVRAAAALQTTVAALVGEGAPPSVSPDALRALQTRGAPELLDAYARIEREDDRNLVVRMVEALVRPQPDWGRSESPDPGPG